MVSREETMVRQWGEVVSQAKAGRILSRHPNTIRAMLDDGRLQAACAGSMVDVRSIARYIEAPMVENRKARIRKRGGCDRWTV